MIRVYDFKCPNGHVSEHFMQVETADQAQATAVQCPKCDQFAFRQLAAPRSKLEGFSGAFPSATDAWAKRRESHMKKERKNQRNHDSYE